jgi:hypothetical protein
MMHCERHKSSYDLHEGGVMECTRGTEENHTMKRRLCTEFIVLVHIGNCTNKKIAVGIYS